MKKYIIKFLKKLIIMFLAILGILLFIPWMVSGILFVIPWLFGWDDAFDFWEDIPQWYDNLIDNLLWS